MRHAMAGRTVRRPVDAASATADRESQQREHRGHKGGHACNGQCGPTVSSLGKPDMQQHTLRVRDSVCAHYPRSAPRVSTWLVALLPTAYGTNQLLGGWLSVADTVQLERMEWVELAVK